MVHKYIIVLSGFHCEIMSKFSATCITVTSQWLPRRNRAGCCDNGLAPCSPKWLIQNKFQRDFLFWHTQIYINLVCIVVTCLNRNWYIDFRWLANPTVRLPSHGRRHSGLNRGINYYNTLKQNGITKWPPFSRRHSKCIFFKENAWISISIFLSVQLTIFQYCFR